MSEVVVTETAAESSDRAAARKTHKGGFFARIILFVRQVIAELKKVVTPTRQELLRYTVVVLVFVMIMMVIVVALDFLFGAGALWVFGDGAA